MAITVQSVINAMILDTRGLLTTSGDDTLTIGWVSRINADIMYNGTYNYLLRGRVNQAYVADQAAYTPTLTNIRKVLAITDVLTGKQLKPMTLGTVSQPVGTVPTAAPTQAELEFKWPKYYILTGVTGTPTITLSPTPPIASSLGMDVIWEKQATALTAVGNTPDVPETGLDLLVAGTNWLAFIYLGRPDEAKIWYDLYQTLKKGEGLV